MFGPTLIAIGCAVLVGFGDEDGPRGDGSKLGGGRAEVAAADNRAADRVTLRDGLVVPGLVVEARSGARGPVEFLVRRDWARTGAGDHFQEWERSAAPSARRAVEQRRARLVQWRRERAAGRGAPADDRIDDWIERELKRLARPEVLTEARLMRVRLKAGEARALEQRPAAVTRWLRLAWLNNLPGPESASQEQLKSALEARGYAPAAQSPPARLEGLLPPAFESETAWLARRAATEVNAEPGLRIVRYENFVASEPQPGGQGISAVDLNMAMNELNRLLNPNQGPGVDPLLLKLQEIAARGRSGAAVTALKIAPDLSGVTVESALWARGRGGRWSRAGARVASVRTAEVPLDAGRALAADPRVQGAFRMVEALGLGAVPPGARDRSLRVGAAARAALEQSRSAFQREIDLMALPVFELERADGAAANHAPPASADTEPAGRPAANPAPKSTPKKPARTQPAPRRRRSSVLGTPRHGE